MPLKTGYSRATVNANVALMVHEGYSQKQAVAAALQQARDSYFKRYPHGALPSWLTPPGGQRLKNPCGCRNPQISEKAAVQVAQQMVKIYADHGLKAMQKAFSDAIIRYNLAAADERRIIKAFEQHMKAVGVDFVEAVRSERGRNPVPESSRSQKHSRESRIRAAQSIYTNFTGHDASELVSVDKPEMPDTMAVIGDVDGIMYTTERDGKVERYIHEFKKKCRPLFCVSHDGKQLIMLGGSYDFTERGIVDRT